MASKSLGTLTIDLVAKTAGFVQGMDKAERESAKFRKKIEKDMKQVGGAMAKAFAIGAAAVAAGTVAIVKKQMGLIDQTSKMAKALNTSYQSMENIKRAAELSGVGIEQLDNAMKKLADNIGEAISGSKTQAEVFDRLGISAKELYSIPVDERVDKINRALKDNIPIAERAAVAADLYGAKNALFMQQIDSGTIEEAARQVKVFGLAISDLDAEKIEMSGDAMSVFGTALDGFEKQLTIGLSTALYGISDAFLDASEDAGGFGVQGAKAADGMVEAFLAVGDVVDALGRTINITGSEFASLAIRAQKYAMLLKLPFSGGADQKAMMEEIKMLNRALGEGESARESILMSPQFSAAMRERIKAAQAELDKMAKENADKRSREVATGTGVAAAKERADSEQKYLDEVTKAQIAAWNERMDKEREAIEEVRKMMLTEEQVIKESYQKRKDAVLEAITLSADEKRELVVALQKKEDEELAKLSDEKRKKELDAQMTTLDNYENLFSSLHDLSAAFGKENSKTARAMFGIAKAAAVAKAMLAISGAAQAMGDTAVTTEQRIAHAATIASAVAGIVSTVKGVKMDGMAHDGIDAVPKTGTWLLEKGERVMTAETSAKLDNKLDGMGGRTKIVNVIDPRMVADYLSTDAGEEIVMNIIGRNQAAVAAYARG